MGYLSSFENSPLGSPLILTAVIGGVLITGLTTVALRRRTSDIDQLIHPARPHWLWGHELEAWEEPDQGWYLRNVEENGLVFPMKGALFHPDLLVVADPGALHHICAQSHRFVKSPFNRPFTMRVTGRGLVWAEGAEHTRQRQMVAPLFTAARVKDMEGDVMECTDNFVDRLRQHIVSDPMVTSAQGLQVNMFPWLTWPTLDIIGKVALDYDFRCGESLEAQRIHQVWSNLADMGMAFRSFVAPLVLRAFPWIGNLPFGVIQAQGAVKTIIKDISRKIVDKRSKGGEDEFQPHNDLIGKLIKNTDPNNAVDMDMMLDQISTFVLTGHDTTTNALAMTLLEIARSSDVQAALRKEITEFEASGPGGQLTYDDLLGSSLPLLDAVCKEGMRVWPIAPHRERMATEDDVIPLRFPIVTKTGETLNSIRVRKGQVLYIPILAVNTNVMMWGADGHKFDPYRWITPGRLPPQSQLTGGINGHLTFWEGTRLCVGYRLAIFELKVILSALVRNFEFRTTDDTLQTMWATTFQLFVEGQKEAGRQLPLFVKPIDT